MPGPNPIEFTTDDYMKLLGALPLMYQPGEKWMYHTGTDVLGLLIARASEQSFSEFLRKRIFAALRMRDTDFHGPAEKPDRFATSYVRDPATNKLSVHDESGASRWASRLHSRRAGAGSFRTPTTISPSAVCCPQRPYRRTRVLSPAAVALMTMDHLTGETYRV
jgi:CubicO group peptidase (beta-lactamase class C family)